MRNLVLALAALGMMGCAMDAGTQTVGPVASTPTSATLAQELSRGALMFFDPVETELSVEAVFNPGGGVPVRTSVELESGQARVVVLDSGEAVLQDLQLSLQDIVGSNPDIPARFTHIKITLMAAEQASVAWFGGDNEGYADYEVDLQIEWALDRGGRAWSLDPLILTDVPLQLSMRRAVDGTPEIEIRSTVADTLCDWAGIAQLSGLEMGLQSGHVDLH